MIKQKNVFLDMTVTNASLELAEKEVMELFKRAKMLGKDKVSVEISLSEERTAKEDVNNKEKLKLAIR